MAKAAAAWCLVVLAAVATLVATEADPGHHRGRPYYKRPYYKRPSFYSQRRPYGGVSRGAVHSGAFGGHSSFDHASAGHIGEQSDIHTSVGHDGHAFVGHDSHDAIGHVSVGHDSHTAINHASVGHDNHDPISHVSTSTDLVSTVDLRSLPGQPADDLYPGLREGYSFYKYKPTAGHDGCSDWCYSSGTSQYYCCYEAHH